ncbi:hypothetical protein ZYGR_0AD05930 [Zygosaccharomyces rouxii]|uniref:ZYRO0G19756p n=2 Tax=Zygosaccharomyces rouxii TaxID=4956 RepID=C5E1B9_ZYGRC|nr:uncharacterized protein ZYRO0G19756g [Zygosaccharomyces rouxii]KAH9202896.1 hypothetical protein LQ764DRAFT_232967 [Zygosaccharomyces rouxii]GAV51410.1 hypothetical protein ZYGR_0AD05930 [Zygosaccharomyces rouxii]CAR29903.1 ZYRO0G19756p [Zygosaccharomyces rouxii]
MQFTTLALTALASAQAVFAASGSQEFVTLAIASGSGLQYTSFTAKGDDLYFGSGSDALAANVTDCGFLQFTDGSYAYIEADGSFKKGSRQSAMPGFVIKDGSLKYNNHSFYGVKDGEHYKISSVAGSEDSIGVLVRALSPEGGVNSVPDYTPDGKDCWAVGPPVSFSKRDVASVSSGNGAAQLGSQASLGVGAAAAVAAMLL